MTSPTVVADVRGASKQYPNVTALSSVDFTINRGEVRALLGKNGAGKSTLIRLLSGAESPDTGEVYINGELLGNGGIEGAHALGVRAVYQELSLIGSMTIAENMFMGRWPRKAGLMDYSSMAAETRRALERLDLHLDPGTNVEELSVADQQMVEISRALRDEPKLLILDEPTSSLAASEVERVLDAVRKIAADGVAVIYVSHRLGEIRRISESASVMRDGRLIDTCTLADVNTREVVRMMIGNHVDDAPPIPASDLMSKPIMLQVQGISAEPKLKSIDFDVHEGEVVGIAGVLGSGRTELLNIIAGIDSPDHGRIAIRGEDVTGKGIAKALDAGVGMTPENRKELGIFPALGVDENIVVSDWRPVSSGPFLSAKSVAAASKKLIKQLHIKTSSPGVEIQTLSGGNQQKAVIGRWLHAESELLLLDEPTRGVDVEAKAQIYSLIRELAAQGRSVIFVSSEIEELTAACDRILVLRGGTIVETHVAPDINIDAVLASAIAEH
jgi:ABC-type sugar transport system ATPase subunit